MLRAYPGAADNSVRRVGRVVAQIRSALSPTSGVGLKGRLFVWAGVVSPLAGAFMAIEEAGADGHVALVALGVGSLLAGPFLAAFGGYVIGRLDGAQPTQAPEVVALAGEQDQERGA